QGGTARCAACGGLPLAWARSWRWAAVRTATAPVPPAPFSRAAGPRASRPPWLRVGSLARRGRASRPITIQAAPAAGSAGWLGGIGAMAEGLYACGCADAFLTDKERATAKAGAVLHVPLVLGALVPAYNLDVPGQLKFSGPVLAAIYLGKITRWNDPALAA